MTEQTLGD